MTFRQELYSWIVPPPRHQFPVPAIGSDAPSTSELLELGGQPTVLTFLRHCGCPFAEKTFLSLRSAANSHPEIKFIAVSHSDKSSTDKWVEAIGGAGRVQVVVDSDREIYAQWGLGISSFWHVLNPWGIWNAYQNGKKDNIWNRPTESGSRWQTGGSFAIDREGRVRWGQPAPRADWIPDLEKAMNSIAA